jgi:hypothetical protein
VVFKNVALARRRRPMSMVVKWIGVIYNGLEGITLKTGMKRT